MVYVNTSSRAGSEAQPPVKVGVSAKCVSALFPTLDVPKLPFLLILRLSHSYWVLFIPTGVVLPRGHYRKMSDQRASPVRVAIDCSFDDLMSANVSV